MAKVPLTLKVIMDITSGTNDCEQIQMSDNGHYQYGQVEFALASAFGIEADDLKAFRARLQHLRRNGVPEIEKVGRGRHVDYTDWNVTEMTLALEFEAAGIDPSKVPPLIARFRMHFASRMVLSTLPRIQGSDWWLTFSPDLIRGGIENPEFVVEKSSEGTDVLSHKLAELRAKHGRVTAVNITARLRVVFNALAGTEPAKRGP